MRTADMPERKGHENGRARGRTGGPGANSQADERTAPSGQLSPDNLLALQRSIGNAAVSRLLAVQRRSAVHDVLRSPGRPLDGPVRAKMEARLGSDFSDVRLHTDAAARESAKELGARAYTSGSDVVIGDSGGDEHTLTHELVHVLQQRQGPVAGTDTGSGVRVSDPSDRFEREAEQIAAQTMHAAATPTQQAPGTGASPPSATRPIQRAIKWHNKKSDELDKFGQALGERADQAALTITQNADSIPGHPGNGYIYRWQEVYLQYVESGQTEDLAKCFGYAVEALVTFQVEQGELAAYLPHGYEIGLQVSIGHTRPDLVVFDQARNQVGWFDITSSGSVDHIFKKMGTGWHTKPFVAEVLYPQLNPAMLSASHSPVSDAAKRRSLTNTVKRKKEARIEALGVAVKSVYNAMNATSKSGKQAHFETQMGLKVADGSKIAPRAAKSLLSMLEEAKRQQPIAKVADQGMDKAVPWMTAFGYVTPDERKGRNKTEADQFVDALVQGRGE
jgi:hypothetical protein